MTIKEAYNKWSKSYDSSENKTRDLESIALKDAIKGKRFKKTLELGAGTGKNTMELLKHSDRVTAVDFSESMLIKAKTKVQSPHVKFIQADILKPWHFVEDTYDLITFSLVLEHIEDLKDILQKTADVLTPQGLIYIGELHPFKQYLGSQARFETEKGTQLIPSYIHHLSDYLESTSNAALKVDAINEYFDDNDRKTVPRVLSLVLARQ